jgi:excisionase family DNA binding protein
MILTVAQVAELLQCSKAHVCNIIRGKFPQLPPLPVIRIGRRLVIRKDAFEKWIMDIELPPHLQAKLEASESVAAKRMKGPHAKTA